MDTNQGVGNNPSQGADGLDSYFREGAGATPARPPASGLDSYFPQDARPRRAAAGPSRQIDTSIIDATAQREGLSPVQRQVMGALLGQESDNGANAATSIDGARGAGQVMPGTFKQYAKPGEAIDNPDHNLAVMARIVKDLGAKSGDDPARMATGYFSGPGNINAGAGQAWRNDAADGNGKRVSSYVGDVLGRLAGSTPAQAAESVSDPGRAPKWSAVEAKPEFQRLSDDEKTYTKKAYFDHWVAPHVGADRDALFQQFMAPGKKAEADRTPGGVAQDVGAQLAKGVNTILGAVPNLVDPASGAARFFNENAQYWDDRQSAATRRMAAEADAKIKSAAKGGVWDELVASVREYAGNPVLAQKFIVETLPSMIPAIGAAKVAQLAAVARGASAARAAQAAAVTAGATNAAMNAGGARQGAYEELAALPEEAWAGDGVYAALRFAGRSHREAAIERAKSMSLLPAAVGGAAGAVSGATGLESALFRSGGRAGLAAGAKRLGAEMAGEQLEELAPQFATNVQAQGVDPSRTLTQGLGQTAVQTAIGAAPGGVMAGFHGGEGAAGQAGTEPAGRQAAPASEPQQQRDAQQPAPVEAQREAPTPDIAPAAERAAAGAGQRDFAPQDILDYADSRYRQLRAARDGEVAQAMGEDGRVADVEQPGAGLSADEAAEMYALEQRRGDVAGLAEMYGFDQPEAKKAGEPTYGDTMLPLDIDALNIPDEDKNDPLIRRFIELSDAVNRAEKISDPEQWTPAQRRAYDSDNINEFSRLRGYTEDEIRQYNDFMRAAYAVDEKYGMDTAQSLGYLAGEQTRGADAPEQLQVPEETRSPDGSQDAPAAGAPANVDPVERRRQAIADYKEASVSGDEVAAQAAEQRLAQVREQLNAAHLEGANTAREALASVAARAPKTEKEAKERREAAEGAQRNAPDAEPRAQRDFTPEQQNLTDRAIRQGVIRPSTLRGERFRSGIIDATNGIAPQGREQSYLDGHAYALESTGKAVPGIAGQDGASQSGARPKTEKEARERREAAKIAPVKQDPRADAPPGAMRRGDAAGLAEMYGFDLNESGGNDSALNKSLPDAGGAHPKLPTDGEQGLTGEKQGNGSVEVPPVGAVAGIRRGDAPENKTLSNRGPSDAEMFGNSGEGPASIPKGDGTVDVPAQPGLVDSHVRGLTHDSEIGGGVVKPVLVDVVNNFSGEQGSSKNLFHNESVLEALPPDAVNGNANESVRRAMAGENADMPANAGSSHDLLNSQKKPNNTHDSSNHQPSAEKPTHADLIGQRDQAIPDYKKAAVAGNEAAAQAAEQRLAQAREQIKARARRDAPKPAGKALEAERARRMADYFAPGNVVKGYAGNDRVVSYTPGGTRGEGFDVTVESVKREDGRWVPTGEGPRVHRTVPGERALRAGPVERAAPAAGPDQSPRTEKEAKELRVAKAAEFVEAPGGGIDFGEVSPEVAKAMRRQAGKIRLERGDALYGEAHIERNHGAQIRAAGHESVPAFVAEALRHIDAVWKPSKTSQLVVIQSGDSGNAVFIELQPERDAAGDYYRVNSAFPVRRDYVEKKQKKEGWVKLWDDMALSSKASGKPAQFAVSPQESGGAVTIPSGQSNSSIAPELSSAKDALGTEQRPRTEKEAKARETDKGVELFDIAREQGQPVADDIPRPDRGGPLARLDEPRRVATLAKLKSLQSRVEAGKLTDAEFQFGVSQLVVQIQERNDSKTPAPRVRGAEWVQERLLRAKRTGELSAESVDFALWALGENPALASDLGISLRERADGATGNYNAAGRIVTLFKGGGNDGTAVHEILHHAERMMPAEAQRGIALEWTRAWTRAWKGADGKVRAALQDMLLSSAGDKAAGERTMKAFGDGTLDYAAHYQLVNASEFWAVNATDILGGRFAARGAWIARARQWLGEMVEKVKGLLGRASDAPVLRGLDAVIEGSGERLSGKMLAEIGAATPAGGPRTDAKAPSGRETSFNDIAGQRRRTEATQAELIEEFGKPTFSNIDWWDKSVGTQFHKAEKNPHFKKVFDLAVKRENAISLTTIRAAELAPAFLPRIDDFKSAVGTLIKGRKGSKQQGLAADAIIAGTLHGSAVLDGKVWSDAELRGRFGMGDHGVTLYRQARAAIDASLDEVAAAEGFAALQMVLPRGVRERVIDDPRNARAILNDAIDKKIALDEMRAQNMRRRGAPESALNGADRDLQNGIEARETMEKIFRQAKLLKEAGYAPLMRFGKHFVSVEEVDPSTGKTVINEDTGAPNTLYFGRFETEGEAEAAYFRQQVAHRGDAGVAVKSGPINDEKYKMYQGVSPETLELFAEAVGATEAMHRFYQVAVSERSALKRRLVRQNIAGFSQDMPRVLSNFLTSNGRHAAGRYYTRDIGRAVKYIPREKGDVQKEAQRLKEYVDNPGDGGAMASSLAFTWFLGGNVASAVINATQPVMMTLPYLSQWGAAKAAAALTRATPYAMGKKQIADQALRTALKRAGQEGKVDAQEIFHLYSVGIQGVAGALTNKLGKLPLVGGKVKGASEDVRARMTALGTLWGMPFAMVEGFNRRLSFIAAWDMAVSTSQPDPYDFAVRAVDATQGIYNKVNRPNWARSPAGRVIFTFAQFKIMNVELLKRMATMGGAEGKKAAGMYLAVLILAAGTAGIPYADDVDDIIDTAGQWLGYNTNMKRSKREWAYKALGKGYADLALYGASSHLPFDFGGRMGIGNIFPATGLLKPSGENNRTQEFLELGGPAVSGLGRQVFDAYDAASMGDLGKAAGAMMPSAIKNAAAGLDMAATGKAKDMKGREKTDVTLGDAVSKGIGFNPTAIANKNRANMPIQQDLGMQRLVESNIVDLWAQGAAKGDQDMMDRAKAKLEDWNRKNPETPVMITADQIKSKARTILTPTDTRLMNGAPREMRGRVAAGLDMEN